MKVSSRSSQHHGFTLIELIIVIAIVSIVVVTTFVTLDPVARLTSTRETRYENDAVQLRRAIEYFIADTFQHPAQLPTGQDARRPVCAEGLNAGEVQAADCVQMDVLVAQGYLPRIPVIPGAAQDTTGFYVYMQGGSVFAEYDSLLAEAQGGGGEEEEVVIAALQLGEESAIQIPHMQGAAFDVDYDDAFSVSLWTKPVSFSELQVFFMKGNILEGESGYLFGYSPEEESEMSLFVLGNVAGNYVMVVHASPLQASSYHHLAVVYGGMNDARFYVNGTEVSMVMVPMDGPQSVTNNAPLIIGTENALFDDVRIYNRALSSAEVGQLHGGTDISNGLSHHWPLNESLNDVVGGAHATVNGTYQWTSDVAPPWQD